MTVILLIVFAILYLPLAIIFELTKGYGSGRRGGRKR